MSRVLETYLCLGVRPESGYYRPLATSTNCRLEYADTAAETPFNPSALSVPP